MTDDTKKVLDLIKKLKAKADSCEQIGNQAEAEAFAAKVQELLIRHKLEMTEVEFHSLDQEDPFGKTWANGKKKQRVKWEESLAGAVARAHFCRILVLGGSNHICFAGRATDREIAVWVFQYLRNQIEAMASVAYQKHFNRLRARGLERQARGYRASYIWGVVHGIRERYKAERAKYTGDSHLALVKVSNAVDLYMKSLSTSTADRLTGTKAMNAAGYQKGKTDAYGLNLRKTGLYEGKGGGPKRLGAGS